jgi:nitrogenase subunit NifH
LRSVAFFNNKGGVGKTTLLCNVASHIGRSQSQKVLVIDCDPQCNTTQLILPEEQCDVLYGESTQEAPLTHLVMFGAYIRCAEVERRSAVMGDRRAIVAASKQPHPAARRLMYRTSRPMVHEQLG